MRPDRMSTKDGFQLWTRSVNQFSDSCIFHHRDQILMPRLNSDIGRHWAALHVSGVLSPLAHEPRETMKD
jgi:hypothetical protein